MAWIENSDAVCPIAMLYWNWNPYPCYFHCIFLFAFARSIWQTQKYNEKKRNERKSPIAQKRFNSKRKPSPKFMFVTIFYIIFNIVSHRWIAFLSILLKKTSIWKVLFLFQLSSAKTNDIFFVLKKWKSNCDSCKLSGVERGTFFRFIFRKHPWIYTVVRSTIHFTYFLAHFWSWVHQASPEPSKA